MIPTRVRIAAVAVAGITMGLWILWLGATAPNPPHAPMLSVVGRVVVGWAFLGVGLVVWSKRPGHRLGWLMALAGVLWCNPGLLNASDDLTFTIGRLSANFAAPFLFALVSFPTGQLTSRRERALVGAAAVWGTLVTAVAATLLPSPPDASAQNLVAFTAYDSTGPATRLVLAVTGAGLSLGLVSVLAWRWRKATGPQRRELAPVVATGALAAVVWASEQVFSSTVGRGGVQSVLQVITYLLLASVAFAFLAGLVRARVLVGKAMPGLVARLARPTSGVALQQVLAEELHDASLQLVFPLPGRDLFLDAHGEVVDLPQGADRSSYPVEREGRLIARIIYDTAIDRTGQLVSSAGAAAALALENARLEVALRAQVAEVTASRARIVEAADAARRRIERDLHDGAQQDFVTVALRLRMAREAAARGEDTAPHVDAALAGLEEGMATLQDLARGIHPAALEERGLAAAVTAVAERATVPTTVERLPDRRYPQPVETTAYFVVAEALANAAKHSHAQRVRVSITEEERTLQVVVEDDGVGGARGAGSVRGSGLGGLRDRVEVVRGTLTVDSPAGGGTRVRAVIPL